MPKAKGGRPPKTEHLTRHQKKHILVGINHKSDFELSCRRAAYAAIRIIVDGMQDKNEKISANWAVAAVKAYCSCFSAAEKKKFERKAIKDILEASKDSTEEMLRGLLTIEPSKDPEDDPWPEDDNGEV